MADVSDSENSTLTTESMSNRNPQKDIENFADAGTGQRIINPRMDTFEQEGLDNPAPDQPPQAVNSPQRSSKRVSRDMPTAPPIPILNPPQDRSGQPKISFDYESLPTASSIRLLKLPFFRNRENTHPDQLYRPMECSIMVVDLDTKPDFFALSYTWGDPRTIYTAKEDIFPQQDWFEKGYSISLNGKPVFVTANLFTALISIRFHFGNNTLVHKSGLAFVPQEESSSYIWIDAICINQNDLAEKNKQVLMMDRIYRQANATVMWLGGDEPGFTDEALTALYKMEALARSLKQRLGFDINLWQECDMVDVMSEEPFLSLGIDPISPKEFVAWFMLYNRSWFTRAWVVQEWVLSAFHLFLQGSIVLDPEDLFSSVDSSIRMGWGERIAKVVVKLITDSTSTEVPRHHTPGVPNLFRGDSDHRDLGGLIGMIPKLKHQFGPGRSMKTPDGSKRAPEDNAAFSSSLNKYCLFTTKLPFNQSFTYAIGPKMITTMEDLRFMSATDPLDKIFAFATLFKDDQGRPEYPAPDYTKSVLEVYVEATRIEAKKLGVFFLSAAVGLGDNPHGLPTWATDFSQLQSGHLLDTSFAFAAALGLTDARMKFLEGGYILGISGCLVDKVVFVQEESQGAETQITMGRARMQVLRRIPKYSQIAAPPKRSLTHKSGRLPSYTVEETYEQSRFEVLWRTLLMDFQYRSGERSHPVEDWRGAAYRKQLEGYLLFQVCLIYRKDVMDLVERVLDQAQHHPDQPFYARCLTEAGSEQDGLVGLEDILPHVDPQSPVYNRETELDALFDINAVIAMLDEDLPLDSEHRPEPAVWTRCQGFMHQALEALDSLDYDWLKDSLRSGCQSIMDDPWYSDPPQTRNKIMNPKKLLATGKGRLGIDPGGIEEGDEIWLVPGLHAPIALRHMANDRYRVVGCIYIHGIMHGEAVPTEIELREIKLV